MSGISKRAGGVGVCDTWPATSSGTGIAHMAGAASMETQQRCRQAAASCRGPWSSWHSSMRPVISSAPTRATATTTIFNSLCRKKCTAGNYHRTP